MKKSFKMNNSNGEIYFVTVTDECFSRVVRYVRGCEMVDASKFTLGDIELAIVQFIDESGNEPKTTDDCLELVRMYL